jgi:hypothetical protein
VLLRNASQHVQHAPTLPQNRKWAMKLAARFPHAAFARPFGETRKIRRIPYGMQAI